MLVKAVPLIKYNYVCKYVVDVCMKQDWFVFNKNQDYRITKASCSLKFQVYFDLSKFYHPDLHLC